MSNPRKGYILSNGKILRSREEIKDDYDNSNIPFPIKPLVKLDPCWNLTRTVFFHSLWTSPVFVLSYAVFKQAVFTSVHTKAPWPVHKMVKSGILYIIAFNALNDLWSYMAFDYW